MLLYFKFDPIRKIIRIKRFDIDWITVWFGFIQTIEHPTQEIEQTCLTLVISQNVYIFDILPEGILI